MKSSVKIPKSVHYKTGNRFDRAIALIRNCCLLLALTNACTGQGVTDFEAEQEIISPVDKAKISPFTVGVYYYPWHGGDFHGGNYLREHLSPPQLPSLGEYDDRDPGVIAQHLQWSLAANVSLWVSSWWGPGRREDNTLLQHILPHEELGKMQIALFYETSGRIPNFRDVSNVSSDITHIAANYFAHPNYLRIDGRPVLFVYLTRVLSRNGKLDEVVALMRRTAKTAGYDLYIVGDQVFGQPTNSSALSSLNAVTNYDVYGSMGAQGYAGQSAVDSYYAAQAKWKALANAAGTAFIPAATPGFNDKGVRDGHPAVSRRLTVSSEHGTLFRAMLQQAVNHTESATGNMLLITSWNEWHEDTQIEPVIVSTPTASDVNNGAYSEGLDYEGYGERYLNILREETLR